MRRRKLVRLVPILVVLLALAAPLGIDSGRPGIGAAGTEQATAAVAGSKPARLDPGSAAIAATKTGGSSCKQDPVADASARDSEMSATFASLQEDMVRLSVSQNPEHLLALALVRLDDDPESSVELMSRALAYDPGNPLLLAHLAETCQAQPEALVCASRDLERDLLRAAGSNGAIWARITTRRHHRGDPTGALDALHRASTAPDYDGYWLAQLMLFERALAAATDYSYPERIVAAIGITSALDGVEVGILRICEEKMAGSVEWMWACRDFGKRLEADSRTLLGTAAGIALQLGAYEGAGEAQEKARALRRRGELDKLMRSNAAGGLESLLFRDANAVSRYMEEFAAHGELAAMHFLHVEAERSRGSAGNSRVGGSATDCFDQGPSPDGVASGDTAPAVGAPEEAPHEVSR